MLFPSLAGNLDIKQLGNAHDPIKQLENAHDPIKILGVLNVYLQTYRYAAAPLKIQLYFLNELALKIWTLGTYITVPYLNSKGKRFQIGCVFVEYDLFNTTTFIQNCIYMNFRINLTQFFYQLLERGTSDHFSCTVPLILYPISFFLYSPF